MQFLNDVTLFDKYDKIQSSFTFSIWNEKYNENIAKKPETLKLHGATFARLMSERILNWISHGKSDTRVFDECA